MSIVATVAAIATVILFAGFAIFMVTQLFVKQ